MLRDRVAKAVAIGHEREIRIVQLAEDVRSFANDLRATAILPGRCE